MEQNQKIISLHIMYLIKYSWDVTNLKQKYLDGCCEKKTDWKMLFQNNYNSIINELYCF